MLWEELTAGEFEKAREECKRTCIIPLGVIEKHNGHLPLGTDMLIGRKVAEEAAKREPVVVFPYYFFGQINEARHTPGTIAIRPDLLFSLLDEVCSEICRNGFNKIGILSSHGGNPEFVKFFMQCSLYQKKDYVLYDIPMLDIKKETREELAEIFKTDKFGGHAGNLETSAILAIRPDLVKMEHVECEHFEPLGRLKHLEEVYTAIGWYSNYPDHYAGEPFHANAEAGQKYLEATIQNVVRRIRAIKADQTAKQLQDEFFTRVERLV